LTGRVTPERLGISEKRFALYLQGGRAKLMDTPFASTGLSAVDVSLESSHKVAFRVDPDRGGRRDVSGVIPIRATTPHAAAIVEQLRIRMRRGSTDSDLDPETAGDDHQLQDRRSWEALRPTGSRSGRTGRVASRIPWRWCPSLICSTSCDLPGAATPGAGAGSRAPASDPDPDSRIGGKLTSVDLGGPASSSWIAEP
jgi:hypothetical protein